MALMMPSCKDFLNPDSISTFDTQYVFSNVDDARKGVNAIYVQFGVDGFRSRLSNNMTGNTDIERSSGWTSSSDRYQIWDLNALSSNGDLRQFWNA
ncbi:MAG: RagB/SusD family nutrient uptake outer membrane protein, partial [Saprospiraceae bacterium]|nr:RagB/SusD family nutrient uptake outer membrane protein [Saprospiraceae bacterium]